MASRITKRTVDALKPGQIEWDADVKGFGVRRQRESRVYVVKARIAGRQRWLTIGRHGSPWTPETARREAKAILGAIAEGKDPTVAREAEKRRLSVGKLAEMFLAEHVEAKRKPRTLQSYRALLERLALPALGRLDVGTVSRADVARLHHSLKATPYQANRALAVLSKMFSWAERHGYRAEGTNPCRHIEKYREQSRERFLSADELGRLGLALEEAEASGTSPYVIAAIRLLIFTGARLSEILELRWENVDFERTILWLPDSKTGKKPIYVSAPALETLAGVPRIEGNPHVIAGHRAGAHLVNLQKPWRAVRQKAGLDDVRIHDLRHSFASVAAAGGASLPVIGKLLGHSQPGTTQKYAHLAADPLRAANEDVGRRISVAMQGGSNADVVPLRK